MESRPQVFACVGPESTGKTTLCDQLANHFNGLIVPEFAREYLDKKNGIYEESDLLTIAKNQLELENRIISKATGPVFCDTDILVIMVWYQFKYRKRDKIIEDLFDQQQPRKYLLTYPDLKWEPDPLRENPNDLHQIFKMNEIGLKTIGADYRIIKGQGDERLSNAVEAVDQMKLD
jgi:nicotinamide riboside kinase